MQETTSDPKIHAGGLVLPPLFAARQIGEPRRVFEEACDSAGRDGAGTFIHGEDDSLFSFAVVLEPEEKLLKARFAFFAGMAAAADALGVHCPPEREIAFTWPDTIVYDTARIGGGRLAWPESCADGDVPDWLVFGVDLIRARPGIEDAGSAPGSISLAEEDIHDTTALAESFTRHLMRYFDLWSNKGVDRVTEAYLERLASVSNHERLIDGRGDLLERREGEPGVVRSALLEGLSACRWYDPDRKEPRL